MRLFAFQSVITITPLSNGITYPLEIKILRSSFVQFANQTVILDGIQMEPDWNQDGTQVEPQVRLGKDSIDKDNKYIVEQDSTKYPFKEIIAPYRSRST